MSHHPSYTMAGLCAAGGIAGFARTRSVPSLVAGLGVGALYGTAGYLMQENKDYGHETAVAASVVLGGAMIPRAVKTRKPVPVALSLISLAAGSYYVKKVIEYS
ncbi:transmembrane proteins 14C-domain-containing protein [Choanephora cucurbitarum]|nr:transmembrane proteins 14C-domain-containing protein [Choanephora cucurbitarum]